ncbi:MAG: toxin-activating lysine-acyltransferase [Hydrogenophaga sp.]|uniref:toxin-activating lysine-acyltransferase n=1 Tax=Hydrogenophaga sp. TaxID=1904254 RepID=UPI002629D0C2|nr:toxin-activating lysine-acyltransferase [Hydrogenophaga sp.]MDM7943913.1 toxin-activating lysine-acyltransferase [Hydrogenophaga sp.]
MSITYLFQAPQLTGEANRTSEAFGAAVWLWMHLPRQRQLSIKHLQNRLLEPVQQGQYVLVSARTPTGDRDPVALLLYACLSARAESRYIAEPAAPMAPADWRSGDRLWLIDWVSPFGQSLGLREAMLRLFARQTARSLSRRTGPHGRSVLTWRGATCTPHGAQAWWQDRPIQSADISELSWPGLSSWGVTVPAELLPRERPDLACH